MDFPSEEYKQLAWGRSTELNDLTETTHIQGHNFSLVHVVFSCSNMVDRFACVSKISDLHSNAHRTEDTFTDRDYVAEILITTDEGPYIKAMFNIEVHRNWDELTMHKMSWVSRMVWRFRNI
jgi:hypothetical protein